MDEITRYVDQAGMDAIGRAGGQGGVRMHDERVLPAPSAAEREQRAAELSGNKRMASPTLSGPRSEAHIDDLSSAYADDVGSEEEST